ncbi:transglycosylase SLT domain-containing protein [Streptomyces sp. KM273126]|uniref:LysM peptidoglycan-binding domain-containing protein n=1 Tax=Streptomyces sp. KM273126 TaxID=2545247 RepID=UPI00103EF47B|nr:LysM peptidoglycan-binding domain-containing protein [Streptomyces sp. KM273126]MBA2808253.1 transglycosylase SLT domain-containing protein [Streptomyces sp. KM273126]
MASRGKHRRRRTNKLTRGAVIAGTGTAALALPFLSATTASAAQPAKAPAAAQAAPQAAPRSAQSAAQATSLTYTVTKGDTLFRIADKHEAQGGWRKIYKDNRKAIGDNPDLIHPGLGLKLKTTKASADSTVSADSTQSSQSTESKPSEPSTTADNTSTTAAEQSSGSANDPTPASDTTYTNDLDGWIRQALDVMAKNGIPGSYDGIHRNIMRESSGNPQAINNWDSNAAKGTPSKGLLQVIDPTFAAYHVAGTSDDPYDPVANIVAACNYAADRYGSIDNVNGPY